MAVGDLLVDVKNIVKTYGPLRAVNDLTFQVRRGEVVGLLGPNGAGKSTTMKILTGYLSADQGTAEVAGVSIDDDPVAARKQLGYLPENAPLYNEMRVCDFLDFIGRMRNLSRAIRKERIEWAVEVCGLKPKFMANIDTLSHGFRRRVGLAQAVLHDPDFLILDEPTSGLDPIQLIEIRKLISELGKTKTVLFSTHVMQEVEAVCNRVLLIHRGKMAADGSPNELKLKQAVEWNIHVGLKGATEQDLQVAFADDPFIGLRKVESKEGSEWLDCRFTAVRNEEHDQYSLNERIYNAAKDKGWGIGEIKTETVSLEDVFLKATGHDDLVKVRQAQFEETENRSVSAANGSGNPSEGAES